MKKFIAFIAIVAFLYSCNSGDRGELVGTKGKKWYPEKPYGMTLVPGGSFIMGKADDDFVAGFSPAAREAGAEVARAAQNGDGFSVGGHEFSCR